MSKGSPILVAERLLGRLEALAVGDQHQVGGEYATVEPVDFAASPHAANDANVVSYDFRLDVRDEKFLKPECLAVRHSHSRTPGFFLSLACHNHGGKTEQVKTQIAHIPTVQLRCVVAATCSYSRNSEHVHLRSIDDSFSTLSARLSPAESAPAVSRAPINPSAAGANLSTGAACLS